MNNESPPPVFRSIRERLIDVAGAILLVVAGLIGGASSSTSPFVSGCIGVIGVAIALFSWNDIGVGCRVEGQSVVGTTITGHRAIDVSRATRIHAYRIRGRWQFRIAGPDGAIAVPASVFQVPELVRSAIFNRPSQVSVSARTLRLLNLPSDVAIKRLRGGRFGGMLFIAFALFVTSGFLGALLFYKS